jgi:hypothetical protein
VFVTIFFQVYCAYEYSAHLNLATIFRHYLVNPKPFLRYLPSIVRRQNFILISLVKKCALYLIKYGKLNVRHYLIQLFRNCFCKFHLPQQFIFLLICYCTQWARELHYNRLKGLPVKKHSSFWSFSKLQRKWSVVNTVLGDIFLLTYDWAQ